MAQAPAYSRWAGSEEIAALYRDPDGKVPDHDGKFPDGTGTGGHARGWLLTVTRTCPGEATVTVTPVHGSRPYPRNRTVNVPSRPTAARA